MTATTTRHARTRRTPGERLRLWLVGVLAAGMALSGSGAAFADTGDESAGPAATASVSGTVTDADGGAGIAAATVVAVDADGNASAETTTTSTGGYTITGLAPGAYFVSVAADGHQARFWPDAASVGDAQTVDVAEAAIVTGIDFSLRAEAPASEEPPAVEDADTEEAETEDAETGETDAGEPSTSNESAAEEPPADAPSTDTEPTFMVAAAPPAGHAIWGKVVDIGDEPISGIEVYASSDGHWADTMTAPNGMYSFEGLPSGTYTLWFSDPNDVYASQYYDNVPLDVLATPIEVVDADVPDVDQTMHLPGTVTGTVTDANGDPIANDGASVRAVDFVTGESLGWAEVVDGEYSLEVFPGTYAIRVEPGSDAAFAPTYAASTTRLIDAQQVTVDEGETTSGIDIEVQAGNTISGAIDGYEGIVPIVYATNLDTQVSYPGQSTDDGYTVPHLPDGEYIVSASTYEQGMWYVGYHGGATEEEAIPVVVDGEDADDIDIVLYGSGGFAGTVGTEADTEWLTAITAYRWNGTAWDTVYTTSGWGDYLIGAGISGFGYSSFGLTVGSYIVSFTAPEGGEADFPFCDQWFEGALTMAGATPFTVSYGEVTTDIDANLTLKSDGCEQKVVVPGEPVITGFAQVGATLTVDPGAWEPQPVTLSYQWAADGEPIDGATGVSYVPTAADAGKSISVTVTGTRPGYEPASATTAGTTPITGVLDPQVPVIVGPPNIGATLSVQTGTWAPEPVDFTYAWFVGGEPVAGATGATYVPTADDLGKGIHVEVTGSKPFYGTDTRASEAVGPVKAPSIVVVGDIIPGNTVTVIGHGFIPGELLRLELHSDPVFLADVIADSAGAFEHAVTIPSWVTPGNHTIVAIRADGSTAASEAVVVRAPAKPISPSALAQTGTDAPWGGLALGGMLLLAGLTLVAIRRRTT